jgi:uncharacterized coiled-coil protein SlyX
MTEEFKNQENLETNTEQKELNSENSQKAEKVISSEEVDKLEETKEKKPAKRYNLEDELDKLEKMDVDSLLEYFENDIIENITVRSNISLITEIVNEIKEFFEKKYKEYLNSKKQEFIDEGGRPEDFKPSADDDYYREKFETLLTKFENLVKEYYKQRAEYQRQNYEKKLEIIEQIKLLAQNGGNPQEVYRNFKRLESEWRRIGSVPPNKYKDIMERYDVAVKLVYDFLEISRELMDMDRQKNYEEKVKLIKLAESLPYQTLPIKSFNELQDIHKKWKEIGPVPKEKRDELWQRLKEISKKINDAYSEFFKEKRRKEAENLKRKTELCEQAEEIANGDYVSPKVWRAKKEELLELDKIWRTIGRVPRKFNDSIYERFRKAFDLFFERRRKFFENYENLLKENLDKKLKLIERVEEIKDSKDWKNTTNEIIKRQNEWKEIGTVPQEESEKIWQKFREVCNYFFDRRKKHFEELKSQEIENLEKKKALIEEIKNYQPTGNLEEDLNAITEFTKRWDEIGYVPIENKKEINKAYSEALKELYNKANIDEDKKALFFYEEKIKSRVGSKGFENFLNHEMIAISKRIKELEARIIKMENNLAFFSDSGNEYLKQVREKIENQKSKVNFLTKKLNILKKFSK